MTKPKSTPATSAVGSNWTTLEFPTDADGITANLRQGFRAAVLRCRGSEQTFQRVLDTLDILTAWATAKLADDRAEIAAMAEAAAAREELEARKEAFRALVQAGAPIKVSATATGFIEQSPRDGAVLAVYDTADDERGPVVAMVQMMLAEGRDPSSTLNIDAFGRAGIGSGQTLRQLAGTGTGITTPAPSASGGLIAIHA